MTNIRYGLAPGDAVAAGTVAGFPVMTSKSAPLDTVIVVVPRCREELVGHTCAKPRGHDGAHRGQGLTWQLDKEGPRE